MHILIVALHRPKEPTGVCRYAANLAKCLAQVDRVEQVTFVTGAWQRHYFQDDFCLNSPKIEILGIDIRNTSISRNLWYLVELPKLVKQIQPSLVHLAFPVPFFRALFPCPTISTIHDLYPYKIPENFGGYKQFLFNRLFLQQCIAQSDRLICVSQATLADLWHYFPQLKSIIDRQQVIYNFVDFDGIQPEHPHELTTRGERPFILSVGQHRKNKNLDLLIHTYARLVRERHLDPSTQLIIVGSPGPETNNLQQTISSMGLPDSVVTIWAISDRELCWLYQNCQLVILPSSVEGFCIPLVEALYFSCRVVCSDIPIFREIAADLCTYFDLNGNPIDSMTAATVTALKSERPTVGNQLACFTKTASADLYLNLYSQVI